MRPINKIKLCQCCQDWKHVRNFNFKTSGRDSSLELKNICRSCQYKVEIDSREVDISTINKTLERIGDIAKAAIELGISIKAIEYVTGKKYIGSNRLKDWNSLNFVEQWKIVTRMKNNILL